MSVDSLIAVPVGLVMLVLGKVFLDLTSKQIEGWLFDLPFAVLRVARQRLPESLRVTRHDEEFVPELHYILFDKYANKPIVGLLKGFRFAVGHVRCAKRLVRESDVERGWWIPRDQLRKLRVRRHWACLLPVLAQTEATVIVTFLASRLVSRMGDDLWVVQSLLWYIAVGTVLRWACKVLEWWCEIVVVTDKRVMIMSGIIKTRTSMIPIAKVTDLSFQQTLGGRMLGYGTLRVESAEQVQDLEIIKYLPLPEKVFDVVSELIHNGKR